MRLRSALALTVVFAGAASAAEPPTLETSPVAKAFGSAPIMRSLRLSPKGTKMVAIQVAPNGVTFARVFDFATKDSKLILSGKENDFDVN